MFEDKPAIASTPSLGFGGASKAADSLKARAVGRKRNGYGKALGDVLLAEGQTVSSVVKDHLASALNAAGYRVVAEESAAGNPIVLDVAIKRYWAYFRPGFWQIALDADIETDLLLKSNSEVVSIKTHTENRRQVATETAWLQVLGEALAAYRKEAESKFVDLPAINGRPRSAGNSALAEPPSNKYEEVEKIKRLLDSGALTPEEYEREKKKLLN